MNYIDDLIYIGLPSQIYNAYEYQLSLLQELGLDISQEKLIPPSTSEVCLGINIDAINRTISIPQQNLKEINQMCKDWATKTGCTDNNSNLY